MSHTSFEPRNERHNTGRNRKKSYKKKSFAQELVSTFLYIIVITGIFVAIRTFLFAPVSVEGDSMNPTLGHEDRLLLNKVSSIDRFDIVVFPAPEDPDKQYIKRVIGIPGDEISYRDQVLYLNGRPVEEAYVDLSQESDEVAAYYNSDFSLQTLEVVEGVERVPEGSYFVMGDNRVNSKDSRSFGFIDIDSVIGETSIRIWPIDRIGGLD